MEKSVVRYSEAFKLQVVSELETGKLGCIFEARKRYAIKGVGTVDRWVRKYGKNHLLKKVVRVESTSERDQLMELKKKNRELESALSDAHLDLRLERAWLKIACKAGGIDDVESFKKKANGTPFMNQ
jgi:transposase